MKEKFGVVHKLKLVQSHNCIEKTISILQICESARGKVSKKFFNTILVLFIFLLLYFFNIFTEMTICSIQNILTMKYFLPFLLLAILSTRLTAQDMFSKQYFDGEDTLFDAVKVTIDTAADNVWQIGTPQKSLFNEAATLPNALVTDTLLHYPANNRSYFVIDATWQLSHGVVAIQWKQKLDFEYGKDGGIIEYSIDHGVSWESVFNNPAVYNFYGFDSTNVDTLENGQWVFTGTDTLWRDVWLCFEYSWIRTQPDFKLRFTSVSDSTDSQQEGWMIDNILVHKTLIHVGIEKPNNSATIMQVFPNPANNRINISSQRMDEFHLIEEMQLLDISGRVWQEWKQIPTHYYIDTKNYESGNYILRIKTNKTLEHFPVIISK
jgi:hypothetical protein